MRLQVEGGEYIGNAPGPLSDRQRLLTECTTPVARGQVLHRPPPQGLLVAQVVPVRQLQFVTILISRWYHVLIAIFVVRCKHLSSGFVFTADGSGLLSLHHISCLKRSSSRFGPLTSPSTT